MACFVIAMFDSFEFDKGKKGILANNQRRGLIT
jgi:hypothetical protein